MCGEGTEQSPVNLSFDVSELAELAYISDMESLDYGDSSMTVLNNGHTVQVNIDAGNVISFDGVEYELKQFHFHADSEHTIDGEHAPMEMHLVHENGAGELGVIGVFIIEGNDNVALADVFANLPAEETDPTLVDGVTLDLWSMVPADYEGWRYAGSLTTPPCSEGVTWTVLATPIEASAAQIGAFTDIFDHNYRPTQR